MQRYFGKEKNEKFIFLNDNDIYHIKTVMRMQSGDLVEIVFDGILYICKVNLDNYEFEIVEKKMEDIDDKEFILIIPLLKEQKMDMIFQKSTELGVSKIIPIITERSVIKLDKDKFIKKRERWQKICKEASEQSKRTSIPYISDLIKIDDLKCIDGVKLVCSTVEKKQNLKFFLQTNHNCAKIVLAIGPEGGFTKQEEDKFVSNGFSKVSLGERIMRVETVPMFVLSILNYEYME